MNVARASGNPETPGMRTKLLIGSTLCLLVAAHGAFAAATTDLHFTSKHVLSFQQQSGGHVLVFKKGLSMSVGGWRWVSDQAVVWLESVPDKQVSTQVRAYLQGRVSARKGKRELAGLGEVTFEKGRSVAVSFVTDGCVFVTADEREEADPAGLELYKKAQAAIGRVQPIERVRPPGKPEAPKTPRMRPAQARTESEYPVNFWPLEPEGFQLEQTKEPDGTYVVTLIGRVYLWQRQPDGVLLELQADSAVVWWLSPQTQDSQEPAGTADGQGLSEFFEAGTVQGVYLSGDVILGEGQRAIRSQELYYDSEQRKALAIDAVFSEFDVNRGIPIYVRAKKLHQLARDTFAAQDVTVTTSEFHVPQISLTASHILIGDTLPADQLQGTASDDSFDVQMQDVRLNLDGTTIFYWPCLRSNLERPDVPIKSIHAGHDSDFGAMIETRWYFSRLLGLQEAAGTKNTFLLDYYGKRGVGTGAELEYAREDHFGRLFGYVISDKGEDDLGRDASRRNLEPPRDLRGRLRWQHRQFLPYNWQLTGEVGYLSDENFLEMYYRGEFNLDKEQETLVHLKRIEDNWGLSILGKGRINDFQDQLEELPGVEFHLAGESLLDDKLTFYSSGAVSRLRQRLGDGPASVSEDFYTFASERAEIDAPLALGRFKVVPFVAGTAAYDDGSGFYTNLDGSTDSREDGIWIGESGLRVSNHYWKTYPKIKSRLFDLNRLRHIVTPQLTGVAYTKSDSVAEQRDVLDVGISQRLQTKRGPAGKQRTVDWMRLDVDAVFVNDSGDTSSGPDRLIWNKPFVPLLDRASTTVPVQDRRSSDIFGPRRNYLAADYTWRLSDTTAVLSDMNYDLASGVFQQFNIGFSHLRWPDLSYYIGSRYLRRLDNGLGEHGSNAFTFAATYVLDPRYTVVFSQQFDFDYGANIRSDVTLIRRYHRLSSGLTFSADESLDRQAIVFSLWLQGVPELAIGPRRYMNLGSSAGY
jgi:hypothetical protein